MSRDVCVPLLLTAKMVFTVIDKDIGATVNMLQYAITWKIIAIDQLAPLGGLRKFFSRWHGFRKGLIARLNTTNRYDKTEKLDYRAKAD